MAQREAQLDSLSSCPICLDLLKDAVTTPCGHSYCMKCINQHWDRQNLSYSCPGCRETFSPRPVLGKNIMLTELVEQLQQTWSTAPPAELRPAGPPEDRRKVLLQQSLRDKQVELEKLKMEAQDVRLAALTAVKHSGDTFTEMILHLEKRRSEVEQQIRSEEQTQLRQIQDLQDQLQRDITDLKRNISELETFTGKDHGQSLQSSPSPRTNLQRDRTSSHHFFKNVSTAVSTLRDKLLLVLIDTPTDASLTPTPVQVFRSPAAPGTREDFLRFSTDIHFDPNTAHSLLSLSDGNRRVTVRGRSYPDHPDRFDVFRQVLSEEALTGRHYWELKWSAKWVRIALAYGDIQRKGESDEGLFGCNEKSWALHWSRSGYTFSFNSERSEVFGPVTSRIGIFLDHRAGVLSFYSVDKSQRMCLLHRVQSTFTQPLLTGVGLGWCNTGDNAHFPKLT